MNRLNLIHSRSCLAPVRFFERAYPSANSVLLMGPYPVLVDTGFGADAPALLAWLAAEGVALDGLRVLNTHAHSDHVGGNWALQRCGVPVAGSEVDAARIAAQDPDACRALWLQQPIEPYRIDQVIRPGQVVQTGTTAWQILATPGHTAEHMSLYADGVLVLGDALHAADVGWLDPAHPSALDWTEATLEMLAALPARVGYSGHGPAITDLPAALGRARRRVQRWREQPLHIALHACKRIFSHALMLSDGVDEAGLNGLFQAPWCCDHARLLGMSPVVFIPVLVEEAIRAHAVAWRDGRLTAVAAYNVPRPGWAGAPTNPARWPAQTPGQAPGQAKSPRPWTAT